MPKLMTEAERYDYYLQRHRELKALQQYRIKEWQDIKQYIVPSRGRFDADTPDNALDMSKILDPTATRDIAIAASGMQGGLTSPARPWFKLTLQDKDLAKFGDVKT